MNRQAFYQSKAWRDLSRAYMLSQHYICERCGRPAVICHHKVWLNAANCADPAIALNPDLLEALCLECHNTEHFSKGSAIAAGLCFDQHGDLIRERK